MPPAARSTIAPSRFVVPYPRTRQTGTSAVLIGARADGPTATNFAGLIDELALYTRALTASEVNALSLAHGTRVGPRRPRSPRARPRGPIPPMVAAPPGSVWQPACTCFGSARAATRPSSASCS
ncbi:MAG TPA: LamG-like jellyroll fold domain-containing protein [Gemmatimonadales bacterium]|nr:LamG-like jellyroll fold domain-containing protein [Gemmatimonadales bacterium]